MVYVIILLVISVAMCIGIFMHFNEKVKKVEAEKQTAIDNAAHLEKYQGIVDLDNEIKARGEHLNIIDNANQAYSVLQEVTERVEEANNLFTQKESQLNTVLHQINEHNLELNSLKVELGHLEPEKELLSFGFYYPRYGFPESSDFKHELDANRERQKEMIKKGFACYCTTEWTVGDSKAEGKKMTSKQIKMTLRAFNGESDACISNVSFSNILSNEKKIKKSFDAINKLNETNKVILSPDYLQLKLEEMFLKYEFEQKMQDEKEEQRAIKEQMREEERVQKEIEKARRESVKEQARYEKALLQARKEFESVSEEDRAKAQEKIEDLEAQLKDAVEKGQRALSMAQQTKRGHIYIISNVGSFGETVYKVGMTRRLEPMDRVKELGDASVPFSFDVHAMIFSEDAPGLENEIHKNLNNFRVNKVNTRKEFFRVHLDQIVNVVKELHDGEIRITKLAQAEQYYESLAMDKQ
ncbi:MAG: DUF4041 domain-containing protein [Lentisphaeraceae bacterium]|nr:DUF4041 domain-containing protein [Lentisphaeraceae bacterium]